MLLLSQSHVTPFFSLPCVLSSQRMLKEENLPYTYPSWELTSFTQEAQL